MGQEFESGNQCHGYEMIFEDIDLRARSQIFLLKSTIFQRL